MTNTNATNFRKNLFEYLNQAAAYNDVIHINTKSGNVILMSEEDYSGIMETLYLISHPKTAQEIAYSMQESIEQGELYLPEEEW